jgi:hypothetical protein
MSRKIVQMMGTNDARYVLYDDGAMYVCKSDHPTKSSQWKQVCTPDTDAAPAASPGKDANPEGDAPA